MLVFGIAFGILLGGASRADEDRQLWIDLDAGGALTERFSAHTKQALRIKDDMGSLSTYFADFGVRYKLARWLTLGGFYRQQFDESAADGTWIEENRPYTDVTVTWEWWGVRFSDRNRVEFREREGREDEIRYRNKLTELLPWSWTSWKLQPYLAQEFFVDEGANLLTEASRVRLLVGLRGDPEDTYRFAGAEAKKGRQLKYDLYLMYDSQERGEEWVNTFVLGLKVGIFF